MRKLNINLSMDCERIHGETCCMGPKDLAFSENSISNFVECCHSLGAIPDLYLTPHAAEHHQQLISSLINANKADCGLHLHVPSFRKFYNFQKIELSNLPAEEQMDLISLAAADFESSLQFRPNFFRAGMGAADQSTFDALTSLNINYGSCTIPEKVNSKYNFDWSDYPVELHEIPTKSGKFLNLPLTENLWLDNRKNGKFDRIKEIAEGLSTLVIYTHNWVDFTPGSCAYEQLMNTLATLSASFELVFDNITGLYNKFSIQ